MGQTIRKPRAARGSAGGRRDQPDKVSRQANARALDRRVREAKALTAEQVVALDARIAAERKEAREQEIKRISTLAFERRQSARRQADEAEAKREIWSLGEARDLVRQGYSLAHTVARTGWSASWLNDVVVGEW